MSRVDPAAVAEARTRLERLPSEGPLVVTEERAVAEAVREQVAAELAAKTEALRAAEARKARLEAGVAECESCEREREEAIAATYTAELPDESHMKRLREELREHRANREDIAAELKAITEHGVMRRLQMEVLEAQVLDVKAQRAVARTDCLEALEQVFTGLADLLPLMEQVESFRKQDDDHWRHLKGFDFTRRHTFGEERQTAVGAHLFEGFRIDLSGKHAQEDERAWRDLVVPLLKLLRKRREAAELAAA